jgi:hypothetical protein
MEVFLVALGVALPGIGVDRSAVPPSSSEVRGATDWQTGHRADSLAVFYMVVTETEVTEVLQKEKSPRPWSRRLAPAT